MSVLHLLFKSYSTQTIYDALGNHRSTAIQSLHAIDNTKLIICRGADAGIKNRVLLDYNQRNSRLSSQKNLLPPNLLTYLLYVPHIKGLKKKCVKALNLRDVANSDWGGDRTVLLQLYRVLIRSKFDLLCMEQHVNHIFLC